MLPTRFLDVIDKVRFFYGTIAANSMEGTLPLLCSARAGRAGGSPVRGLRVELLQTCAVARLLIFSQPSPVAFEPAD